VTAQGEKQHEPVAAPLFFVTGGAPVTISSRGERRTTTTKQNNDKLQGEKPRGCPEFHPEALDGSSKPEDARRRRD
jgi:hypothetical protein